MILYNIRNMGAYISDVLRLNIFQLCNKVREEKKIYAGSVIHEQYNELDFKIRELTQCDRENTLLERLLLLKKARETK